MTEMLDAQTQLQHMAFADGSSIVRVEQLPWTPWGMPGTYFKLLKLDDGVGMMVFLLKVDPNVELSPHKHFGNANVYVLKGGFGYENGQVFKGDYMCEGGGITHKPFTYNEETLMLAFGFGPVAGFDDNGNLVGLIDNDWMYEAAKANGAADHIVRPGK